VVVEKHVYTPEEMLKEMLERTPIGLKNIEIIKKYLAEVKHLKMPSEDDAIAWFKKAFFPRRIISFKPSPIKIVILQTIGIHRPNFETATKWGNYWFQKNQLLEAEKKGYNTIDWDSDKDIYKIVKNDILSKDPILITGVGHGDENAFTGQNYNIIYSTANQESLDLLKNRLVHLLSCEVGANLGKKIVENGAKCFCGYKEVYIFVISNFPNSYAKPFFNSDFQFDAVLYNGLTAGEAFEAMIQAYKDALDDPSTPEQSRPYLKHDMEAAVFYGDKNARITGGEEKKTELWITLIDCNGKKYPVYDKIVPVNQYIIDSFTVPKVIPEGDGEFYIISKISNTDVAHIEVPVKFVKKEVKHRIIVDKPQPNEEIAIGKTYTFKLKVEYK